MLKWFQTLRYYHYVFGLRGLVLPIRTKLMKRPLITVTRPGLVHPLQLRLRSSDVPTYVQTFIHDDCRLPSEREPKVIMDAGANIGLVTALMASRYPAARVIAIEPEVSNFDLLSTNAKLYPNVETLHAALWHRNEDIDLVDPGAGNWGFRTFEEEGRGRSRVCQSVQGKTVDRIMNELSIDYIDVLKIDIEGAEKEVFHDASAWISRVGMLIVELHEEIRIGCNRSFYNATNGFGREWMRGEKVLLARD